MLSYGTLKKKDSCVTSIRYKVKDYAREHNVSLKHETRYDYRNWNNTNFNNIGNFLIPFNSIKIEGLGQQ
jgi:hypothetical protein